MPACVLCPSDVLTEADREVLDFEYGAPGSYTYWRCERCGVLHIDPEPDADTLSLAYPGNYHAYLSQPNALARWMKRRYWRKKALRCARLVGPEARILDAGCANGDLLVELRRIGYDSTVGLDFNEKAVATARAKGFEVYQGEIDDGRFEPASLDMIVMTNFIEHVYRPVETLRTCRELLRPGGIIVGETPNIDSWDYKLFRRNWGGYHTPRHLCLFDTRNLGELSTRAGLRVRSIANLLQPAHWALSIQNRLQETAIRPRIENGRSRLFTPLLFLALPINVLQMLVSRTSLVEFVLERPTAGVVIPEERNPAPC